MKKTVLFTAALFAVTAVSAQTGEITSNRGENWLSQDGDYGITFDANPLLNYAGNLFNGHNNNGIGNGLTWLSDDFTIRGKKLMDANTAYRAQVRIGFGSKKTSENVDDATSTDPTVTVEDVMKHSYMAIDLGVGLEKRVGSTRVVGVYGAMFNVGFGNSKDTYEYGNSLSNTITSHTNTFNQGTGVTESKNGSSFHIGLNAFAGIEWFCAPKVSLSGEYTWGLGLSSSGYGSTTQESWNGTSAESTTADGGQKKSNFSIDTGVSGGMIGVNFYFQ
ncbi:MAG: hypothetical protein IPO60_05215 [Flavobacteriales bacterium]|jgi:hypothetical protein|nr:hypothetical protein [Flavobacteriales bacterium]MBK6894525.1 hypothetical protein [Flavobacteriales bacterium]MBK7248455.1 hypothetical protein [Flavobacteriales bacterium]MBK9059326.1 hypothetical protein [Flavobacteriales bacterium]MBK9597733.1 hypothetical protein [Flavobacteriales bacterium]